MQSRLARCGFVFSLALVALAPAAAWAQMSPEAELKTMRVPDDFEVSLFASEPMITNPTAIDVDTKGRVWVAQIQGYRSKLKPEGEQILVLEDTDGDGKADKVTVFAEHVFSPMSICVAGDKVYVATSPDLWVFEDKDGDLKADGPPKKLLTGFGGYNHDHGAHSLVLGPDHKWWMAHGDRGFDVKGTDGSQIKYQFGAMLRGELDGSQLEIVARNFRNPYEVCVSSFGEPFCSDNDNDGNEAVRIAWIMEGGDYGWFGHPPFQKQELDLRVPPGTPFREAWHFRGHIPGYVPGTLVTGFGSPTGICFYEGDAFGPKYKNAPLHTDCGPREVRLYRHQKFGAGMKATSEVFMSSQGDNYFRPDDICAAPDGRLYVSDWYDAGVGGHAYNNPDQGRIFMLKPKGKKLERHEKPGPYSNTADAIEGLKSPNLATQFLARQRLLADAAKSDGAKSIEALKSLLTDAEPNNRARALWVLDRIGGDARKPVLDQLKSADETYRALGVRILRRHGDAYAAAILPLADDASAEVRREVLLALPAMKGDQAEAALVKIARGYDGSDRYLLEAINIAAADRKEKLYAELAKDSSRSVGLFPLLALLDPKSAAEMLTARLAAGGIHSQVVGSLLQTAANLESLDAGRALLALAGNRAAPVELRLLALQKLSANLLGNWAALTKDPALISTFASLLDEAPMRAPALSAIGKFGIAPLGVKVLALVQANKSDPSLQAQAIGVIVQLKVDGAAKALNELLKDAQPAVRQAALNGLVDLQDMQTLRQVLSGTAYPADVRAAAAARLMETTGGALVLLRMIDAKQIAPEIEKTIVAKAATYPDANVRVLFERFIPAAERPKKLGEAIKADDILALSGDAARGEAIFTKSSAAQCKNCHAIHGAGGTLGPDLGMIGKKYDRRVLLESILDPSKAIAPEFIPYVLETTEGQVYAGFLIQRNKEQIILKDVKSQLIRVPVKQVEALVAQKKSLMPELVLRDVTAQDAADLLAFLTTLNKPTHSVDSFRVLGPFDVSRFGGLNAALEPEKTIANPDLKARFAGPDGKMETWEVVPAETSLGFPAIDSVKFDRSHGQRTSGVAHFFLVYVDSAAEQSAKLLLGSDDGCQVWVNGKQVHKNDTARALAPAQDQIDAQLKQGRNVVVVKVVNNDGPGGVCLTIRGAMEFDLRTE